ncbi:MAG: hypothetical protein Q8T11_10355 [Elusimicrobiota bacterium]|nr:hypothetical protein [Elusimicrobiota bacterium]
MTNIMAAAALIASQIGAPVAFDAAPVVVPPAKAVVISAAPRAGTLASGYVSASGTVSGSGYLHCSAPQNGSGWMSGSVNLSGSLPVNGPDGARGSVPVSGHVYLTGSCQNGGGFVSGSAFLQGSGSLYGRDGRLAGTVRLDGSVFISQYASSSFLWVNQFTTLSGYFTAAN